MAALPVTHPSADVLRAFALGKLNDGSAAALMSHLDSCPDCCKQVAALSGDDFLKRLRQARGHSSASTPAKEQAESTPRSLSTRPPGHSGTPMPGDVGHAAKPPVSRTPVANLPPELAASQQYEILRELGRGGMGVVYLAKNKLMDRLEVLKVVNKMLLDHPGAVERFLREIRSAAKLSHANVVGAYSALQMGELLAFAMEYVEGQDLASLVKSQGALPIQHACYYTQQAALGLQHAFEKGMVHRDIKPQNLILAREGKKHIVKVLDFGLAKATREKTDDTGLTGEGKMLGTPDYIAPEQTLDAAKADIRADIYSLGCTLYYLLSGHPPFSASSLGAILVAHQMHEAKPLNLERPEVPEELAAVVRKMMAKSPAKRYQTPLDVVQALDPFVKQGAAARPAPELSSGPVEMKPAVKKTARADPLPEPSPALRSLTESSAAPIVPKKSGTIPSPRAAIGRERRPPKKWLIGGGVAVGLLLLALLGMWAGGVFRVKTKEGTIVLENLPADAAVTVDGERAMVTWSADTKKAEITVKPGTRKIVATHGGMEVIGEEVEIAAGGHKVLTARLEPIVKKPNDGPEPGPREKQLKDLMVAGSVWRGTVNYSKGNTAFIENSRLDLYIQQGNGSSFNALFAHHRVDIGPSWRFVRPVRGSVKANNIDFHSEGSDLFFVTGTWKAGYLEVVYHKHDGAEAAAKLKLEEARQESAKCVLSVFHRNDTEGWSTLDQNGKKGATQPVEVHSPAPPQNEHDNHHWLFARCIRRNPNEWGWHAPNKYHGDHSGKFGRCLMYSILCSQTGKTPPSHWYVRLRGAGMTLFLDGTTLEPPLPGKWKHYCIRLDASAGWKHPGGKRATDEDIKRVLPDVTDLRIKGEYGAKSDGCLADVEFGADDPYKKK